MIRIRLINEGRVVKQITSRLHEGVVLEQVKNYKDPFDTVQIVEGDLSEGAKDMLQHVARKIIPAAMAAGVAMSAAGPAQAQGGANPNYPGLNHSVGQHMADIFSPNYKEAQRQREFQRSTERQVWNAEQNEIRKQRMADARARAGGGSNTVQKHVIYDQSRMSKDGKSYIIYGIDNTVRRIPVAGTEYMAGDAQRLPHYITSGGNVLYVRHPHAVTENVNEDGRTITKLAGGLGLGVIAAAGAPAIVGILGPLLGIPIAAYGAYSAAKLGMEGVEKLWDMAAEKLGGDDAVVQYTNSKIAKLPPEQKQAAVATVKQLGESRGFAEGYNVTRGIDRERYTERPGLEGPFSTRSGKVVYYDKKEGKYYDPETDFYISHEDYANLDEGWKEKVAAGALAATMALGAGAAHARVSGDQDPGINRLTGKPVATQVATGDQKPSAQAPKGYSKEYLQSVVDGKHPRPMVSVEKAQQLLQQMGESIAEDATVGTIPAAGTVGTSGRTQFAPTGKTTNAKFNKNGQIELDTEQEDDGSVNLDADAVKQLQQAGVQIKEGEDSPVASAITRRILLQRHDLLSKYGPVLVMQAIDEVADYVGDVEEIGSSDVSGWIKQVEQMLQSNPPEAFGENVNEGTDTLEGILSKFSADYAKFKAGGDIDENEDFFQALYDHYFDEMPYGVKKARDGDPYEWITDRLDQESGIAPVAEAADDEATAGDQTTADQNIIMQIRKASDYEKPTKIELADGTESVIAPNIAKQLLAKFDKMKPESKALLQDTLNTEEGFKEILAYFGGGVREQAAVRAGNIMQAAMAEAGFGRDAYQRDYDSSVSGMGRGPDHRGLNQELAHEDNDQYRVVIAHNGKWEETKAQPRSPGMNAAMALINSLHAKYPTMHLGMMWPNGKVENYGKKA